MSLLLLFRHGSGSSGGGGGGIGTPIGLLLALTYATGSGTTPPPAPVVGWAPTRPWKPSKRTEKEIEELLEEIKGKAENLAPRRARKLERTADDVVSTLEDIIALHEAEQAQAQVDRLMALLRGMARAGSIKSTFEWAERARNTVLAIEELETEDDLLLLGG